VDDAGLVGGVEAFGHLKEGDAGTAFSEAARVDVRKQATLHVFHAEEDGFTFIEKLMDAAHVGMSDAARTLDFGDDPPADPRGRGQGGGRRS